MAFFRTINFTEPLPSIEGDGIVLRTPQMTDFEEWSALREASRGNLAPDDDRLLVDVLGSLKLSFMEMTKAAAKVSQERVKARP